MAEFRSICLEIDPFCVLFGSCEIQPVWKHFGQFFVSWAENGGRISTVFKRNASIWTENEIYVSNLLNYV
jgi:hypothetical protein